MSSTSLHNSAEDASLPVAVMLGFGGSRRWWPEEVPGPSADAQTSAFEAALLPKLTRRLADLPRTLGLDPTRHFLCGQAQMAVGADMLFAQACAELGMAQRVVLPEPAEGFLCARGSNGHADFDEGEQERARQLLASPHVVDVRVASQEATRRGRFEATNVELVCSSDVVVVLLRADAQEQPGGSQQLLNMAKRHGKPVCEIRVQQIDGMPVLNETQHNWPDLTSADPGWHPPSAPADLSIGAIEPDTSPGSAVAVGLPISAERYLATLKRAGSQHARRRSSLFNRLAIGIIGAHVLATLCAVLAMKVPHESVWFARLLITELVLLLLGFACHNTLHHSQATRRWAMARLVAELARSARALGGLAMPLRHLFELPFPDTLQPLLRTVNLLHLGSAKLHPLAWQDLRDRYAADRLGGSAGQLRYYARELGQARGEQKWSNRFFYGAALLAFLSTLAKLLTGAHVVHLPLPANEVDSMIGYLGVAAILLPLFAVAALSMAAAADLDARAHTYEEVLVQMHKAQTLISLADSEAEVCRLVSETEAHLMGETSTWASRRAFTSVA